jgi:hypothetical protein
LKHEVATLRRYKELDYLRDLLMKEEQRQEALEVQLLDIGTREIPLQGRLDEIDTQLRPDRLEQSLAGIGSLRPEEERDAARRQLGNERRRIQAQLDLLRQARTRLQAAMATSDAAIGRLKQRINEVTK